jgi:hypothetical protein
VPFKKVHKPLLQNERKNVQTMKSIIERLIAFSALSCAKKVAKPGQINADQLAGLLTVISLGFLNPLKYLWNSANH